LPDCARAAFRISSVESFFAILHSPGFSARRERRASALECPRRGSAGSAYRFGRILSARRHTVHTDGQGEKRFPISRNDVRRAFPSLRTSTGEAPINRIENQSRSERIGQVVESRLRGNVS
jgi:hypothetical protein